MLRKPLYALVTVILILPIAVPLWAGTTGKIAGIVIDKQTSEPLPGVSVQIVGSAVGAATNIQGEFFIINVPPGVYYIRANLVGYAPVEVKNLQVSVDLTSTVDFELTTQTVDMGVITVEAEKPLIEKDITSSRTTITPSQLTNSAVDGIVNAVNLTAGSVLGSFRGGRADQGEVVYLLDGINVANPLGESRVGNNPGSGTSTALATVVPNESITEAEVLTGGFGAEYPNVQSAVINMVTKEAGDKYAGKVKSKSSPDNLFSSSADLDDKNRSTNYDMRQHEFSLSGPVPISAADVPGKLAFSASGLYDFHRSHEDSRAWSKSQSLQGKLIYQVSASKKLTVSGLRSSYDYQPLVRNRGAFVSWGVPDSVIQANVSPETNQVYDSTIYYTPYFWLLAPGYTQADADTLFFNWLYSQTDDSTYLQNVGEYDIVPESLKWAGRDYLDMLAADSNGFARSYTNYDMYNTIVKPETWSYLFGVNFNSAISAKTFYNLNYSVFKTAQSAHIADPWDGHPMNSEDFREARLGTSTSEVGPQLRINPMYVQRYRQDDHVTTHTFKGDFTSQIDVHHQMKFGAEFKLFDILYDYASYASGNNEYNSYYQVKPYQLGVYAQDKIETEGMIVNAGLRFDYFDPKTFVPFNPDDPVNPGYDNINDPRYGEVRNLQERLKNPVEANRKHQLSPRVGLSYPITEKDVLHVTYGHYFQLPVFDDFYTNHAYDLRGAFKYIGNPDLKEQKTVAYEAGLEHGFNDFLKVSITGYFKDISNLINQQLIQNPVTGARYYRYINVDYARIKGFEIAFTQRPWNNVTGLVTYTYQIAKGRASAKDQGFEDVYFLYKPRTEDYPLDWDQRNTAKANINYRIPPSPNKLLGDWGLDFVFTFGSGKPYSSTARVIKPNLPPINDKNLPDSWEMSVRLDKGFDIYKSMNINAFVEVRNLTDRANIIDLIDADKYDVSGYPAGPLRDPLVYSAPRRILLGAQLTF